MRRVLKPSFFARSASTVARELLGKFLVRELNGQQLFAMIAETEAYLGPHDKACHAHRGRTSRNAVMFGPAGYWYVYFIYGMHWMLNVVTAEEDYPAAVLFRAAGPWIGPGRLTKGLSIDRSSNGQPATRSAGMWIEDRGVELPRSAISRTPRIGVDYALEWAEKPLRYVLKPKVAAILRAV
jgi:DNA-3-methyladenine glycosylase